MRGWGTEIHRRDVGSGIRGETCSKRVGDAVWDIRSPGTGCEEGIGGCGAGSTQLWASPGKNVESWIKK